MKGIIIYKSKYGSTKQFAEWMQEDTGFDLYTISKCPKNLNDFDVIIVGSSIHAGSISVKDYLITNWPFIKDKKVVMILTSGASNKRVIDNVVKYSFPPEIMNAIKVFPVGGRYVFDKMSFIDRSLIKIVAFFTKHPETKKGMLTERDDVDRNNLKEVLEFIKTK